MKKASAVVAALLLGLVLGGWGVRSDLREARKQADDLRRELARRGRRSGGLDGIATMLRIPEGEPANRPQRPAPPPVPASVSTTGETADATAPTGRVGVAAMDGRRPRRAQPQPFRERLETAAAAWKTRSDLARSVFVSSVAQTEEEANRFDVIIAAMNLRISNSVRSWVDAIRESDQPVTPETGVRMFNDLSGALVLTYDELDRTMPAGWREKAGPEFKVMDFINPEAMLPLADVEGRFADMHREEPPPREEPVGHRAP